MHDPGKVNIQSINNRVQHFGIAMLVYAFGVLLTGTHECPEIMNTFKQVGYLCGFGNIEVRITEIAIVVN